MLTEPQTRVLRALAKASAQSGAAMWGAAAGSVADHAWTREEMRGGNTGATYPRTAAGVLNRLCKAGYARYWHNGSANGSRWFITDKGREYLATMPSTGGQASPTQEV